MMKAFALAALAAALAASPALAQAQGGRSGPNDRNTAFGTLGSNKEPIKIDADRLDVFDKESRAVFDGNVVAVQGDSTMNCATLTVHYEPRGQGQGGAPAPAPATNAAPTDSSIRKIECKGPVTIVSKTQVATGDHATFDRQANKVYLTGNVALTDGPNITRGERIVYDLNTSIANVETKPGGRVRALFVPGSGDNKGTGGAGTGGAARPQGQGQGGSASPARPATN